jgi:hypothetical protein
MAKHHKGEILRTKSLGVVLIVEVVKDSDCESSVHYQVQQVTSGVSLVVLGDEVLSDASLDQSVPLHIPFARYRVDPQIRRADLAQNVATSSTTVKATGYGGEKSYEIEEDNYVRNPTRVHINTLVEKDSLIEGAYKLKLGDSDQSFETLYVVDRSGAIYVGTRPLEQRLPHPTLIELPDPEALSGGLLKVGSGLLLEVDLASGHFKPGMFAMEATLKAFSLLPPSIYHEKFKGFKPFEGDAIKPAFSMWRFNRNREKQLEAHRGRLTPEKQRELDEKLKAAQQKRELKSNPPPPPTEDFGGWMRGVLANRKGL